MGTKEEEAFVTNNIGTNVKENNEIDEIIISYEFGCGVIFVLIILSIIIPFVPFFFYLMLI